MAAAVAAGIYKNLSEAAQKMVKIKSRIEPIKENFPAYEKKLALYKKVSGALDEIWKEFN
jgi:sugar (pentulose or hexulose) kinase